MVEDHKSPVSVANLSPEVNTPVSQLLPITEQLLISQVSDLALGNQPTMSSDIHEMIRTQATIPTERYYTDTGALPIVSHIPLLSAGVSNIATNPDNFPRPSVTINTNPAQSTYDSQPYTTMPGNEPQGNQSQNSNVPPFSNSQMPQFSGGINAQYTYIDTQVLLALINQNQQMLITMNKLIQTLTTSRVCKMIPLGKYNLDHGETFPQFLQRFENYAISMYPDSTTEGWGTYLGSHLEGDIKQVYDIISRNDAGYSYIKRELLEWFKKHLDQKTQKDLSKFYEAQITPGETIPLYALRLIGLADRAFPGVDPKSHKVVRDKLIQCLPPNLQTNVKSQMMVCEISLNGEPLNWEGLVKLVEQNNSMLNSTSSPLQDVPSHTLPIRSSTLNKQVPEIIDLTNLQPPVMTTPIPTQEFYNNNIQYQPQIPQNLLAYPTVHQMNVRPQTYQNNIPTPAEPNNYHQQTSYAQVTARSPRRTHEYRRSQPNITSNKNGTNQNTRRSDGNKSPRRQQTPPNSPKSNMKTQDNIQCNYCKRNGHDVRDCRQRPYCQFCGKRGHIYRDCYLAKNKCIRCEETGHVVTNCPRKNQLQKERSDDPECPFCGNDHLGINCPQGPQQSQRFSTGN